MPRSVSLAADWSLLRRATFFDALLPDGASARAESFDRARRVLASCDFVFLDPDNGIEVPSARLRRPWVSKYVYWSELKSIYAGGQSLLVYQHFPRVVRERFIPFVMARSVSFGARRLQHLRRRTSCSSWSSSRSTLVFLRRLHVR